MLGLGLGPCGMGLARGRGCGRRFSRYLNLKSINNKEALENLANVLKEKLNLIEDQIKKLEQNK